MKMKPSYQEVVNMVEELYLYIEKYDPITPRNAELLGRAFGIIEAARLGEKVKVPTVW
jgi:hypothetical protein